MQNLFEISDLGEYVEGTIQCPDPNIDPVGAKNWRVNTVYAKILIDNNIPEEEKTNIQGCKTAHEMWKNLRSQYESQDALVYTDKLQTIFQLRATEGSNIAEHVMKLKRLWDQLGRRMYTEASALENDVLFKRVIAQSLPRSWNEFTKQFVKGPINLVDKDPKTRTTSQQMIGMIKHEYNLNESQYRKEARAQKKGNGSSLAKRMGGPSGNASGSSSSLPKKHCSHCGRDNHNKPDCKYKDMTKCDDCNLFHNGECWKPGGKRPWKGKEKESSNKKKKDSQDAGGTPQANVVVEGKFVALQTDMESDDEIASDVNVSSGAKIENEVFDYLWLADSAAAIHVTNRRDAFATYEPLPNTIVSGVGGTRIKAAGKGTVYLRSLCDGIVHTLQLNDVFHIPETESNILSVGCWEHKWGRSSLNKYHKVTLITEDDVPIARGPKIANKLYRLSFALAPAPPPDSKPEPACFTSSIEKLPWETLHRRFGHISYSGLEKLVRLDLVDGIQVDTKSPKPDCIACTEAKLFEAPYGPASRAETKVGELTHVDLWGKYDVRSIHGNQYYLLLIDDAARHITVEFLKRKSQAAQKVKDYMMYLKARGASPCAIRMDRGTEFVNEDLRTWTQSQGIQLQMTAPYSPSQNGVAERMNRTLVELARAMLADSKLPEFLWELAVAHAAYLRNMSYTSTPRLGNQTPYQVWHGRKPDASHLREFGAPVWVLSQGQHVQRKMLPKSQRRAYVGYDEGSKAVKYYNAATKNILTSRNYRFLVPSDASPPEEIAINPQSDQGEQSPAREGEPEESTRGATSRNPNKRPAESDIDPRDSRKTRGKRIDYDELSKSGKIKEYKELTEPFPDEKEAGILKIVKHEAYAIVPDDDDCHNLREARQSPEWPEWKQAIEAELDQLKKMGTWELVERPKGVVPIGNKLIFTKKRDKIGRLLRYKARLVAKGYAQRPGRDYIETHSPVVRLETIRAILAIAPTRKLHIQQMDVKGAYLNGILNERVYMRQPEGHDDGTGRVCLLKKTLYGLKQAGREWNKELDRKLKRRGYVRLRSDPCVYIWRVGEDFAIITVWVDDLLLFSTTIVLMNKMKSDIKSEWEVTDLGEPTKIVGIEITMTPDSIAISSSKYIESILRKEGLERSNAVSTPLDPNVILVPNPEGNAGDRSNSFARLLGELQYIACATRPDIQYAVNRLASYTANPSLQHTTALKRILRYLSGTRSHGIVYKSTPDQPDFYGYADAAYMNGDELRSTTGYVFMAGDGAISWCSKRQISRALSSTAAEYVALSEASREACWLRNLYWELGLLNQRVPTMIRGDNEGSLAMARNPQYHKRSKHIDLRWHWIRELIEDGVVTVDGCRDPDQTADILTKALHRQKHQKHAKEMGLVSI